MGKTLSLVGPKRRVKGDGHHPLAIRSLNIESGLTFSLLHHDIFAGTCDNFGVLSITFDANL